MLGITYFPIKSRLPIYHRRSSLFCSAQALLCHGGCFYHESVKKQACPPALTEKGRGLSAYRYLLPLAPGVSGHRKPSQRTGLKHGGLCSPRRVLQSQPERRDIRAGTHPRRGTNYIHVDAAKFNLRANSRATTKTCTKQRIIT